MDPSSEAPRLGSIEILEKYVATILYQSTILYQISLQEAIANARLLVIVKGIQLLPRK